MGEMGDNDGVPPLPDVIRVECYAGYRGEQEPRRFHVTGSTVEVVEIVDRWQGPDHRSFRVRGSDGAVHLLRHDEVSGFWERIPEVRRGKSGGMR
jgi:hypothetical protein